MALEWIRDNIGAFGGKAGGLAGARNFIRLTTQQETQKTFKSRGYLQASLTRFQRR
jgi:carboxylesterase type B